MALTWDINGCVLNVTFRYGSELGVLEKCHFVLGFCKLNLLSVWLCYWLVVTLNWYTGFFSLKRGRGLVNVDKRVWLMVKPKHRIILGVVSEHNFHQLTNFLRLYMVFAYSVLSFKNPSTTTHAFTSFPSPVCVFFDVITTRE